MQARMKHPAFVVPDAFGALMTFGKLAQAGLDPRLLALVHLRASQINGCAFCVDMHARELEKAGEKNQRIFGVSAWRDSPYFSDAERAALALTEAVTRLSDREDPVPDDVWKEATKHFPEKEISVLLLTIATVNLWNRLNVATAQVAGSYPT